MLGKMIVPACAAYSKMLAEGVAAKKSIGVDAPAEVAAVRELTDKTAELMALEEKLKDAVAGEPEELNERAMYEHETVIPAMEAARKVADELELKVGKAYWRDADVCGFAVLRIMWIGLQWAHGFIRVETE